MIPADASSLVCMCAQGSHNSFKKSITPLAEEVSMPSLLKQPQLRSWSTSMGDADRKSLGQRRQHRLGLLYLHKCFNPSGRCSLKGSISLLGVLHSAHPAGTLLQAKQHFVSGSSCCCCRAEPCQAGGFPRQVQSGAAEARGLAVKSDGRPQD